MIICLLAIVLQLATLSELIQNYNETAFGGAVFSFCAMYEDGQVIAEHNSDRKLNTASTLKAVTTGTALNVLGEDYRWETTLAYRGKINPEGVLLGDLYIIGGGDPMLGSNDSGAEALTTTYGKWAEMLKKRGITAVKGNIIGDGSWIEGMREQPSWSYDDLGTYYGTCVSGLNFFENMQQFSVSAVGLNVGDKPNISPYFPATPWMKWEYDCSVGEVGSGDKLYLYTSDLCESGIIRGTYAAGREGKLSCRNNYPERSLACDFAAWLNENGIKFEGEGVGIQNVADPRSAKAVAEELEILGSTLSPSLSTVITRTNKDSNNMYAELLSRTLGREMLGHTDPESANKAVIKALSQKLKMSTDSKEVIIADGSGLSIKNRVSAKWMCRFLCGMTKYGNFDTYLHSLVKYSARCWYKTGSFTGCRCLCGYLLPSNENAKTITFCIMVNNSEMKIAPIDKIEKELINALSAVN